MKLTDMKPLSKPFYIAGVKYATDAHRLTPKNDIPVVITHNPGNAFDPFALEARVDGVSIGHIPRQEQACWFYHTSMRVIVTCRILEWDRSRPPYEEIKVVFECDEKFATDVLKQGPIL